MYKPTSDREGKKLNDAYRDGTVIQLNGQPVRVVGMTRGIPPMYLLEPVKPA